MPGMLSFSERTDCRQAWVFTKKFGVSQVAGWVTPVEFVWAGSRNFELRSVQNGTSEAFLVFFPGT